MGTHHSLCFRIYDRAGSSEILSHTSGVRVRADSFTKERHRRSKIDGMQMDKENTMSQLVDDVQRLERAYQQLEAKNFDLQMKFNNVNVHRWEEQVHVLETEISELRKQNARLYAADSLRFSQILKNNSTSYGHKVKLEKAEKLLETIYLAAKNHLDNGGANGKS